MPRYLKLENKTLTTALLWHAGIGFVLASLPSIAGYWQLVVLIFGCYEILVNRNRNNQAGIYAAYVAGMEVLVRMSGYPLFWELGKYGVTLLLLLGILISDRKINNTFLVYLLLLLPSILVAGYVDFAQARDMISFNLSGPLCLALSAVYFHNHRFGKTEMLAMVRALVLPIIVMLVYLVVQTPDFSEIQFDTHSNMLASGGYGPNQVSLVLGAALFFIASFQLIGVSVTGYRWLDYTLVLMLAFRALLTFSRGGVAGAIIAIGVLIVMTVFTSQTSRMFFRIAIGAVLVIIGSWLIWDYANELSHDSLSYRYSGINPRTGQPEEYTTGRLLIAQRDLRLFQSNPLFGIGPGRSKLETMELKGRELVAHTEWTRMLAEHGVLGLIALIILFFIPLVHIFRQPPIVRGMLLAFYVLAMFSMFHAAMRLAVIGFLFSWALLIPVSEKNFVRRK